MSSQDQNMASQSQPVSGAVVGSEPSAASGEIVRAIRELIQDHGDDFHICEACGHQHDAIFGELDLGVFIKQQLAKAPSDEAPVSGLLDAATRLLSVHDEFDRRSTLGVAHRAIEVLAGLQDKTNEELRKDGERALTDLRAAVAKAVQS